MQFFIRQYLKGKKGSGTDDIYISDSPISQEEFLSVSKSYGHGKYLLCARGKGIRGFKKLDEFVYEEPVITFDAEFVSVKQNLNLEDLSNNELFDLMGSMIKNAPTDPEGQQKFMSDLENFHSELESRNSLEPTLVQNADEPLVSAGFPIGSSVTSFVLGALTGGLVIWLVQKNTIDELKTQIASLENSMKDAEESIKKVKKQAESMEKKNKLTLDQQFLATYNNMNGWKA